MMHHKTLDLAALVLLIIGGINWGLYGLLDKNIVAILPEILAKIVYVLIGLSGLYGITWLLKK